MELEKATFLRVLKGAPLSVLISLWVHGSAGQGELRRRTGYDKATLKDALDFLEDLGLVLRPHYRKWALSDGFTQLPFAKMLPPEIGKNPISATAVVEAEIGNSPISGAEIGNSPISPLVSSSSNNQLEQRGLPPATAEPDEAILAVCREVGIYGRKRVSLACLSHVIEHGPSYVRGHVEQAGRRNIGLAIYRIEQDWPLGTADNGLSNYICEGCSMWPCRCEDANDDK